MSNQPGHYTEWLPSHPPAAGGVVLQEGTLYNMNDGRKTLQNVFALELFENVQVGLTLDAFYLQGVVLLKRQDARSRYSATAAGQYVA